MGLCATRGTVTLAYQDERFQDVVILHELLHLRVPNHGRLFKASHGVSSLTWKRSPAWIHSGGWISYISYFCGNGSCPYEQIAALRHSPDSEFVAHAGKARLVPEKAIAA